MFFIESSNLKKKIILRENALKAAMCLMGLHSLFHSMQSSFYTRPATLISEKLYQGISSPHLISKYRNVKRLPLPNTITDISSFFLFFSQIASSFKQSMPLLNIFFGRKWVIYLMDRLGPETPFLSCCVCVCIARMA